MIIMVRKTIIVRDREKIFTAGRVRLIKCSYNGFSSVRLMSIRVIESQDVFY